MHILQLPGFPGGSDSKESANLPAMQRPGFNPWVGKTPWRRNDYPLQYPLLPGKSDRQRSLVGCRPLGRKELHMTEQLTLHFLLQLVEIKLTDSTLVSLKFKKKYFCHIIYHS